MRKITAFTLLTALIFTMTGCGNQDSTVGQPNESTSVKQEAAKGTTLAEIAAAPFNMNYQDTQAQVKNMASNDSFETIGEAGPLYAGKESEQQPGLKKFRELKLQLVTDIMKTVQSTDSQIRDYASELKKLKNKYIDLLGQTLEQNKKLGSQMKQLAQVILAPEVAYTTNLALFKSINPESTDMDSVKANLQYQQVYLTLESINLLSNDTAQTIAGLINLQSALQASSDSKLQAIATQIESDIPTPTESLTKKLATLQNHAGLIDQKLKQIDTAEYFMGQASVQYMQTELAGLNTKLATLTPNENISAEDIAFIKDLTKYYGDFAGEIKQHLDKVDQSKLLASEGNIQGLIPTARAGEEGYASKALGALTTAVSTTYEAGKTVGSFTWSAGKTLVGATKTTIGVTLDTLAATAQTTKDIVGGVVNGDSMKTITTNIKDNYTQVADNYNAGRSGSDVLTNARGYFEGAEKLGGDLAEGAVEKTLGKGWTSWMAGHVGKLSVNLFTSLGKGITAVTNKESTTGETLEGMMDIGMSFIGGSKVIASGSQMMKGGKELMKNFGQQGLNFVAKTLWAGDVTALKALREELKLSAKMTAKELESALVMNAENISFKEKMVQEMKAAGEKLREELKVLMGQGRDQVIENMTQGASQAYKEFVKDTFDKSLKGIGDSIIATLGTDMTKFFDNIVGNKIDDLIKGFVKDAADSGKIPGLTIIPDIKDLAGHWGNGSMTVTDVTVTEEFKKKAKEEGCDYAAIAEQKGKSMPMDILMEPTGAEGGNLTLKVKDGKPQIIPFTYKDGVISAQYVEQGANINLKMNVSQEDGQIKSSGPMVIDYGNGGLKITASTETSKAAPGQPDPPKTPAPTTPAAPTPGSPATPGGQTPTNPSPVTNDFSNT